LEISFAAFKYFFLIANFSSSISLTVFFSSAPFASKSAISCFSAALSIAR